MVVAVLFIILLAVLVSRAAKRHQVSSTWPLVASLGFFLAFTFATSGLIRVKSNKPKELVLGLALALGINIVVAAITYLVTHLWIQKQAVAQDTMPVPPPPPLPPKGSAPLVGGICATCGERVATLPGAGRCPECGEPFHKDCLAAGGRCVRCAGMHPAE